MKKREKTKQHFLCFFYKSCNLRHSDFLVSKDASVALLWNDLKILMPLSNFMCNEGKKESRKSLKFLALILLRNIICEMSIPK